MRVDPVEAVEKARESVVRADAEMNGSARMGHALAHVVNAVQALAEGLEAVADPEGGDHAS